MTSATFYNPNIFEPEVDFSTVTEARSTTSAQRVSAPVREWSAPRWIHFVGLTATLFLNVPTAHQTDLLLSRPLSLDDADTTRIPRVQSPTLTPAHKRGAILARFFVPVPELSDDEDFDVDHGL